MIFINHLYKIIFLLSFLSGLNLHAQLFTEKETALLKEIQNLLPKSWIVEQKGDTFILTKPDSIWVKGYRCCTFKTKPDTFCIYEDYETRLKCLSEHDGTYRKILYQLHLKLEPKWTEEKVLKAQNHNDSLIKSFIAITEKYPTTINGKSYNVWDRYWISYTADSSGEKRKRFEKEKEFIRNQIKELPWQATKFTSVFFSTNRDLALPCKKEEDAEILALENNIIDLITRDTFDLGSIRYKSLHTKRKIKLIVHNRLETWIGPRKNKNEKTYFKVKRNQRYVGAGKTATLIYYLNSTVGNGTGLTDAIRVVELPGIYPKKTIVVKWRVLPR